jgi:hypothetical protein
MTLGTFACILAMQRGDEMIEDIDQLAGLSQNNLPMAFVLAMLMFSLAGIPPLAGFWAKVYVFLPAVKAGLYPARHHRCDRQRHRRLLLPAHRQDHVLRRTPGKIRTDLRQTRFGDGLGAAVHFRLRYSSVGNTDYRRCGSCREISATVTR